MDECNAVRAAQGELNEITALLAAEDMDWGRWDDAQEELSDIYSDIREYREKIRTTVDKNELQELNETLLVLLDAEETLRQELAEFDGIRKGCESPDEVLSLVYEYPLSIEVRSGWVLSSEELVPEHFCILLQTGGPAVRIVGDLNEHGDPDRAWIEYQDWGTPWETFMSGGDAPLRFAQKFVFTRPY